MYLFYNFISSPNVCDISVHVHCAAPSACLQTLENVCYAAVQTAVFKRAEANSMKPKNLVSLPHEAGVGIESRYLH